MEKARQKKFAKRSRKGCITCRKRRKRCDEARPTCENCIRVNVPCEWAVPVPVAERRRPSRQQSEIIQQGESTPDLPANIVPLTPTSDPNTTNAQSHLHMYPCPTDTSYQALFLTPNPSLTLANPVSKEQQYLLTYYIHTLVPTFSVVATSTAYHLSLYVPMAFQSIGVLNAILACAASHLAKTSNDEIRAEHFLHMTKVHQLLCQQYLQQTMTNQVDNTLNSDETLAVLMLLVALETQNGSKGEKWQKQLRSAGRIIAARGGPRHFVNAGWESRSVFGHFLYHDCCSMIMSGVLAEAESSVGNHGASARIPDWTKLCTEESLNVELISEVDPLMGLASSLFMKIRRIHRIKDLPYRSLERDQLFLTLEQEISEWCVQASPIPGHAKGGNGLELAAQLDLIALAETYRLAAMMLLYRTSDMHVSVLPKLGKQIMAFVARIPDGNQVESGLPFPLFMAGGELTDWVDMQACALKLRGIRDRTRIMNIQGVEEVLESVWRSRLNGCRRDWVDVLREEKRVICVA